VKSIGIAGRYSIGYHPEWFSTVHKNRIYVEFLWAFRAARTADRSRKEDCATLSMLAIPVDKRNKTL
jgi:hypothetical protein